MSYLGIDIGGTKIAIGLYDENKKLLSKTKFPTFETENKEEFLEKFTQKTDEFLKKSNVNSLCGIGIGIPGIANGGVVVSLPNLPALQGVNLEKHFSDKYSCKVMLGNDANLAALAQYRLLKRSGNMVYITISTGIGCGIIINGKVFTGDAGAAGEAGHMLTGRKGFDCACGNNGCYEVMASGKNITKKVEKAYKNGIKSELCDIYLKNNKVGGTDVAEGYRRGDDLAIQIVNESGSLLGELCYNIYMLLNIKTFCIGGGLTAWGEPLFAAMKKSFTGKNHLTDNDVSFLKAFNSDDAGILGAALLVLE